MDTSDGKLTSFTEQAWTLQREKELFSEVVQVENFVSTGALYQLSEDLDGEKLVTALLRSTSDLNAMWTKVKDTAGAEPMPRLIRTFADTAGHHMLVRLHAMWNRVASNYIIDKQAKLVKPELHGRMTAGMLQQHTQRHEPVHETIQLDMTDMVRSMRTISKRSSSMSLN